MLWRLHFVYNIDFGDNFINGIFLYLMSKVYFISWISSEIIKTVQKQIIKSLFLCYAFNCLFIKTLKKLKHEPCLIASSFVIVISVLPSQSAQLYFPSEVFWTQDNDCAWIAAHVVSHQSCTSFLLHYTAAQLSHMHNFKHAPFESWKLHRRLIHYILLHIIKRSFLLMTKL